LGRVTVRMPFSFRPARNAAKVRLGERLSNAA